MRFSFTKNFSLNFSPFLNFYFNPAFPVKITNWLGFIPSLMNWIQPNKFKSNFKTFFLQNVLARILFTCLATLDAGEIAQAPRTKRQKKVIRDEIIEMPKTMEFREELVSCSIN